MTRFALTTTLLLSATLATGAAAQSTPFTGDICDDCSTSPTAVDIHASGGEFYAIKVRLSPTEDYTDWMFDLGPGRDSTPSADASTGPSYIVLGGNFTFGEAVSDVFFSVITLPGGRVALDSATLGLPDAGSALAVSTQWVGNSLPLGELDGTGLVLAPGGGAYQVPNLQDRFTGAPGPTYPYGTRDGIQVAFAPLVDINDSDVAGGAGCSWGGAAPDPNQSNGHGLILGYNVYRLSGAAEPTRAQIGVPANFVYFMGVDGFDMFTADSTATPNPFIDRNGDGVPDGDGTDAVTDANADGDLVGLQNMLVDPNFPTTGDEVLIFSDQRSNPDQTARIAGTVPAPGTTYWYAFQPVVRGSIAAFANASIAKRGSADHRVDMNSDGTADAVNLDLAADPGASSLEFISPQANLGLPGLGLTNAGIPVLSQPVRGIMNPAAAVGGLRVDLSARGAEITVRFAPEFETADVLGYDVLRVIGSTRTRVNGTPLLAAGGEGRSYELTDRLNASTRRLAREARVSYVISVLSSDGSAPSDVGPFELETDPLLPRATRRR